MQKRNNVWENVDWITIGIYLTLMSFGWINIYSAVYNEDHKSILDFSQQYGKQLMWIGAAVFMAVMLINTDSKFFVTFAFPIYILILMLLMLVPLIGTVINGAKSWITIGNFLLQPSEFMKTGVSLALARYISSHDFKMHSWKSLAVIAGILFLPVGMIFFQNDTGSALVFGVFLLVLFREGLNGIVLFFSFLIAVVFILTIIFDPLITIIILTCAAFLINYLIRKNINRNLVGIAVFTSIFGIGWLTNYFFQGSVSPVFFLLVAAVISSALFLIWSLSLHKRSLALLVGIYLGLVIFAVSVDYVFDNIMQEHHRNRINELLGIQSDIHGSGYHVNQSKIAIGSGGFFGKGFLQGTQTKFDFVPEQSTDFIFCTVGEEWGFLGTTAVIGLFVALLMRLIFLAERNRSKFSRVYGYCVATILFFHFAVNIGMTIGLAPVIGIPLPFFSYGGSSLWSFTLLLFIFIRLDASRFEQLSF